MVRFLHGPPSQRNDEVPHLPYPSTRDAPLVIDLAASVAMSDTAEYVYQDKFGAIRPGGPVRAFANENTGLLISGFMSSFVYQMLRDSLQYILEVRGGKPNFIFAATRFVDSTAVLAFFVGLMSDCLPLFGLRRKSYLLIGWLITCAVLFVMMIMTQMSKDFISPYALILLGSCASFGTMVSYVASEIRLVELSQRETLHRRGFLVAVYTIFRISGQAFGRIGSRLVLSASSWDTIRYGFVVIFLISLIAPSCVYRYLVEPTTSRPRVPCGQGFSIFKQLAQQHVVRYVIAFVCLYTAFSNVRIADADSAVTIWTGVGSTGAFTARVGRDFVAVMTVCLWTGILLNEKWPQVFALGPVFNSVPPAFLNIFVATKIYRANWFYFVMSSMSGISDGIFRFAYLIPLVEICSEGSEGQTVGLVLSFDKLLSIVIRTATTELFRGANWSLSQVVIYKDTPDAHNRVAAMSVAGNVLRSLAIVGLIFLPSQKAEAQRQKLYGNMSPTGATMIIVAFAMSLIGVIGLDFSMFL